MAGLVWRSHRHVRDHGGLHRRDGLSPRRVGYLRVVGVLQPRASVRALGRRHPDDRRAGRGIPNHPRVDCDGRNGDDVLLLRPPDPEPRLRRLGWEQPKPL